MNPQPMYRYSIILTRIGIAIACIGWYMRIFHYPRATLVFTIGGVWTIVTYLLRTLSKPNRFYLDWVKFIFILTLFIRGIVSINHWPFNNYAWSALSVLMLTAAVIIFFKDSTSLIPRAAKNPISKILFSAAGSLLCLGVMFKIMHWPGAFLLFTGGTISLVLWLLIEPFLVSTTQVTSLKNENYEILDEHLTHDSIVQEQKEYKKFRPLFGLAGTLMIIGLVMTILHWPGGNVCIAGGLLFGGIYLFLTIRN